MDLGNETMELLQRDEFREQVLFRDNHKCVNCDSPAIDAHHLIERSLWKDGGYYLQNGVSLCENCHLMAEYTQISVKELRRLSGVFEPILPEHLYTDEEYDKWGNIIHPNGNRSPGELFHNENVQKALKNGGVLNLFTKYIKYPRSYHFPWSENLKNDDRMLSSTDAFYDKRVIITEKMDGENTTLYNDFIHARSLDSKHHESRDWVKAFWGKIKHEIPEGWRICGENLYAKHSILYNGLPSYFLGFNIWNEKNICLSWDDTKEWFDLLGIVSVPTIYDGIYPKEWITKIQYDLNRKQEGYVVRLAEAIAYRDFKYKVGKWVRKNHVQTSEFWMHSKLEPNELAA